MAVLAPSGFNEHIIFLPILLPAFSQFLFSFVLINKLCIYIGDVIGLCDDRLEVLDLFFSWHHNRSKTRAPICTSTFSQGRKNSPFYFASSEKLLENATHKIVTTLSRSQKLFSPSRHRRRRQKKRWILFALYTTKNKMCKASEQSVRILVADITFFRLSNKLESHKTLKFSCECETWKKNLGWPPLEVFWHWRICRW